MNAPNRTLFYSAVVALACSAAPAAQAIQAQMRTLTNYGNFARIGTGAPALKTLPANRTIPGSGVSLGVNKNSVFADTLIGWRVRGNIASADVSEQGGGNTRGVLVTSGTTVSTSANRVVQAPHALLFEIRGPRGTRGQLEMWASGVARAGTKVTMSIDVHNNGRLDFTSNITAAGSFERHEMSGTIPASGVLRIRILTSATLALSRGNTLYKTGLSIRFTPGVGCDVTPYGASCGPRLSGSTKSAVRGGARQLVLELTRAARSSAGLLVLGSQRLNARIPGTSCFLLANALVVLPFVTDAAGSAEHKFKFPSSQQFTLFTQDAVISRSLQVTTSNGVAVVCR